MYKHTKTHTIVLILSISIQYNTIRIPILPNHIRTAQTLRKRNNTTILIYSTLEASCRSFNAGEKDLGPIDGPACKGAIFCTTSSSNVTGNWLKADKC